MANSASCRLLVVEDHADTAMASAKLLAIHGYEVKIAASQAEALSLCRAEAFDLLLIDLGLPDGDGVDLLKQVLRDCPMKAIAISGYTMNEDVQQCKDAGFADYIAKPVAFPVLLAKVEAVLGARRVQQVS